LPELQQLGLERCELTKEDVAALAGLRAVHEISLYDNPVDDEAVRPLETLPHLVRIDLDATAVSPAAFQHRRSAWSPRYRSWNR